MDFIPFYKQENTVNFILIVTLFYKIYSYTLR